MHSVYPSSYASTPKHISIFIFKFMAANLVVASGGHCLGGLLKKQEHEQSKLIFRHFLSSSLNS